MAWAGYRTLVAVDGRHTSPRSASDTALETTDELDAPALPLAGVLRRGDSIGRYTVLEHLGSGAMGIVYAAYDSALDRKVALKLLHARPGHEEGSRRAQRLLREAQALAQLTHPNVVTVHDVGTADGRVFLAMEHVQGQTLTRWLEGTATPRTWGQVLGVMLAAGRGLAAAHAKGLVHRDFKPDNVMIGDDERVRVMDFGLARAGDSESAEASGGDLDELDALSRGGRRSGELAVAIQITRTGAVLGTPAYMAPEQHLGRAIDARSDQFAYCVTLHEALYGARPFAGESLAALGMAVTRGIVREPPPGRAVPKWLRRVVLRGLSTAPEARFASMEELLRALEHEPRRRRWLAVATGSGVLGLSLVGLVLRPSTQTDTPAAPCRDVGRHLEGVWDEARAARVAAAMHATGSPVAADTIPRVEERLRRYVDRWVAMRTESCVATRLLGEQSEELLDLRNACLDERLRSVDDLVSVLENADAAVVERAVAAVAELPTIEPCADAVALRSGLPPPQDPARSAAVEDLRAALGRARAQGLAGRYEPARRIVTAATSEAEELEYLPLVAEAHALRGELLVDAGEPSAAEQALVRAYFVALQVRHDEVAARVAGQLTYVVGYQLARYDEGSRWGEHALAMGLRVGEDHLAEADAQHNLGVLADAKGDSDAASRRYERAFALRSRHLPPDHPDLARSINALGNIHLDRGEYEQALARYREALALRERVFGPHHPEVAGALNNVGIILQRQRDYAGARQALERALTIYEGALGMDNPRMTQVLNNLGTVLREGGDPVAAEAQHRRAIRIRERALGPSHPDVGDALVGLGRALSEQGRDAEAEPQHQRALELYERAFGPDHPLVAEALVGLALARLGRGHAAEAEAALSRAMSIFAAKGPATAEAAEAAEIMVRVHAARSQ